MATVIGSIGVIGADSLWLVPLGSEIAHGHLPSSIPYASATTTGWHDVPAGGQLLFWAAYHAFGGEGGLVVLQSAAGGLGIASLCRGLSRQSSSGAPLIVSVLVVAGSLPAFAVTNVSLFSLLLFPVLLGLLESETALRTGRIWLAVPVLVLWGNLHGAVVVGWALLGCYLVFDRGRRRPAESTAVLAAGTLAVFVNPVLWHTPSYYSAVFHNVTAARGVGLWAPLSTRAFDALTVAVFVVLIVLAVSRGVRFRLWEAVAALGLAIATIHVARNGVWLLLVCAYPAARGLSFAAPRPRLLALAAVALTFAAVAGLVRAPPDPGSLALARSAARTGKVVLAEPLLGEQVALAGGRVWVDNPIDAFRPMDQRLYVDWFSGQAGSRAVEQAGLVLVDTGSKAERVASNDHRLVLITKRDGAALYRVRAASS